MTIRAAVQSDRLLLDSCYKSFVDSVSATAIFARLLRSIISVLFASHSASPLPRIRIAGRSHLQRLLLQSTASAHTDPLITSLLIIIMSSSNVAFGSLSVALAQAITYLTRPLIARYSAVTIIKLQLALEANLTAQFSPSWSPSEPLRGSGRRCLTLTPNGLPPRTIYNACKSAGVQWSEWIALLGNVEFDLFIDPGCVSVRFGSWDSGKVGKFFTIWSEDTIDMIEQKRAAADKEARLEAELKAQAAARAACKPTKTYAQQLLEVDQDDEELFALIADEIREPTWLTPILCEFPSIPAPARDITSSPMSTVSTLSSHSRSSSSSSSSGFTFSSVESGDSYGSSSTISQSSCALSPSDEKPKPKLSRRERARQARVFVDSSKNQVTNYDGGKTTVLTGGVMLGGGPTPKAKPAPDVAPKKASGSNFQSTNWRSSTRA
ncbi:hypothetical protein BD310DRAFT_287206 [Dichomitus squalens]|uniref:Anti-proliferative protein domain-containing protein n=1 Tax=Dichomitus squalens TaxID=114155 RepID=A0A4Q9QBZ6_9APHY|nr:hypothetical protein BD310DRAFT_287206 [Dichomitus squalens]